MKKAVNPKINDSLSLDTKKISSNKPPKQKERFIESFLRVGKSGFYQIEAYKLIQVTCLHTYISNFEKVGINFSRKRIMHHNSAGGNTHFMRYWLADENAYNKALDMLNFLRSQRGVEPIQDLPPYWAMEKAA